MSDLVSIAIPTYNRLGLLKPALDSVLAQTYENMEIIISDNNSEDGTIDYLKSLHDPRVKVFFSQENRGMAGNWQKCLINATGKYFLLLSDDDILMSSDAITKLVSAFEGDNEKKIGMVFCDVITGDKLEEKKLREFQKHYSSTEIDLYIYSEPINFITFFLLGKIKIFPSATLLRREDVLDLGGYVQEGLKLSVDFFIWYNLLLKYKNTVRVPQTLVFYRIHNNLTGASCDSWLSDFDWLINNIKENTTLMADIKSSIEKELKEAKGRIPIVHIKKALVEQGISKLGVAMKNVLKYREVIFTKENLNYTVQKILRKDYQNTPAYFHKKIKY